MVLVYVFLIESQARMHVIINVMESDGLLFSLLLSLQLYFLLSLRISGLFLFEASLIHDYIY